MPSIERPFSFHRATFSSRNLDGSVPGKPSVPTNLHCPVRISSTSVICSALRAIAFSDSKGIDRTLLCRTIHHQHGELRPQQPQVPILADDRAMPGLEHGSKIQFLLAQRLLSLVHYCGRPLALPVLWRRVAAYGRLLVALRLARRVRLGSARLPVSLRRNKS